MSADPLVFCPLCGRAAATASLAEAGWIDHEVERRVAQAHPGWRRHDGACPACVQEALLALLLEHGEEALHAGVQSVWPLDAEAAFGALPERQGAGVLHAGRAVSLALAERHAPGR